MLIDPSTDKGKRLRERWDVPEKPNRHVVCYTFVRACIVAQRRLSKTEMDGALPFFLHGAVPVEMSLHESIDRDTSNRFAIDIEVSLLLEPLSVDAHVLSFAQKHGGVTETTEARARVIIAPNNTEAETAIFESLRHQYEHHTDKFVEDLDWVKWCIDHKKYEHTPPKVKNMGGRKPGSKSVYSFPLLSIL